MQGADAEAAGVDAPEEGLHDGQAGADDGDHGLDYGEDVGGDDVDCVGVCEKLAPGGGEEKGIRGHSTGKVWCAAAVGAFEDGDASDADDGAAARLVRKMYKSVVRGLLDNLQDTQE